MRTGGEEPGSAAGSGNARTPPGDPVDASGIGRLAPSLVAGNRAMISPSSAESGMARAFATRTMGGITDPGGSVRSSIDQRRPSSQDFLNR